MKEAKATAAKITWLGHAAFLIETPGGTRIAIDPFVSPKFPKGFDYGRLDIIAATHGHFDHFGTDGVALAKKSGATVVCIFELALFCQDQGIEKVSGMNKGGSQTVAGIGLRMVHAVHSSGTSGKHGDSNPSSDPCGFVITLPDGYRIYHAGDTNVFSDMTLIAELYEPDVALLPIGDFYTMGPREAAKACELLDVPRVIPMHWGTFPVLVGTPAELREEIGRRGGATEVIELVPGQAYAPPPPRR